MASKGFRDYYSPNNKKVKSGSNALFNFIAFTFKSLLLLIGSFSKSNNINKSNEKARKEQLYHEFVGKISLGLEKKDFNEVEKTFIDYLNLVENENKKNNGTFDDLLQLIKTEQHKFKAALDDYKAQK